MTEATQQGADLDSAAKAISSLMDAGSKRGKPSESAKEPTTEASEKPIRKESQHEKRPAKEAATKVQEESEEKNQRQEADPNSQETDQETENDNSENEAPENEVEYELPSHIDALAEAMGVDSAKLFNLKVKTKIDGQEGEATLADLIKSYQLEGHLNKKSMALSDQQKAYEAKISQQQQALDQQVQELNTYYRYAENELFREFQNIDWNTLKEYDQAKYAVLRQEFNDRYQAIVNFGQTVNQKIQHQQMQQQESFKQQILQTVEREQKQLMAKIPEWSNDEKKSAEQREMRSYLKSHGFDDEDIKSVIDHRYVVLTRKAWLYDKLAQSKPDLNKKVKTLPAFIKQSGLKTKADVNAEKYQGKIKQLRKSGSIKDAASLLYDMI
jgi:hypothetical protein